MALFTAEFTGLLLWFLIPKFRDGQFGGSFIISTDSLPGVNEPPIANNDGRFWLVQLDSNQPNELMYSAEGDPSGGIQGVAAIYKVCTHLGCIYPWNGANNRFECPCHGSKYRLDGRRIESPAPRTLDRFAITALDDAGEELGMSEALTLEGTETWSTFPLPDGTVSLKIDTGNKKKGATQKLLCTFTNSC
ncbi:MAG TPA: hypothetical protein ENJ56_06940 [Anaerolineae bacterium]|nr:hypothetical protein [Anaerolineae bacterium]